MLDLLVGRFVSASFLVGETINSNNAHMGYFGTMGSDHSSMDGVYRLFLYVFANNLVCFSAESIFLATDTRRERAREVDRVTSTQDGFGITSFVPVHHA